MTIEANVCLPSKLAIFASKWEDGNSEKWTFVITALQFVSAYIDFSSW